MRLIATPLPEKSHGIRVWSALNPLDQLPLDKASYDFCCNLLRVDETTCEVAQAMGNLTDEVAIALGTKAIELGYKRLTFARSAGGPATHWATKIGTHDGLDYYTIDLIEALKAFKA